MGTLALVVRTSFVAWACVLCVSIAACAASPRVAAPPLPPQGTPQERCDRGDAVGCTDACRALADGTREERTRAASLCARACERDHVAGCAGVVKLRRDGYGDAATLPHAVQVVTRGCDAQRVALACTAAAAAHFEGLGVERNRTLALRRIEQACELGEADGCADAATLYAHGAPGEVDLSRSRALAQRGCAAGSARGCFLAGMSFLHPAGAEPADFTAAHRSFGTACERGLADACRELGIMERDGEGVTADPARARALFERSCEGGSLGGCSTLALQLMRSSEGADRARAEELFASVCERGGNGACEELFRTVRRDPRGEAAARSNAALERACARPVARACALRAVAVLDGNPGGATEAAAAAELDRLCAGGDDFACGNAARVALAREGDSARGRLATMLLPACDRGDGASCEALAGVLLGGPAPSMEQGVAAARRACERSDATCSAYGQVLVLGRGAAPDVPRGVELLGRACALDSVSACEFLASGALDGSLALDAAARRRATIGACSARRLNFCVEAGTMLWDGRGGPADRSAAAALYERACAASSADGCALLSDARYRGQGVAMDVARADADLQRACAGGHVRSCAVRARFHLADPSTPPRRRAAELTALRRACDANDVMGCHELARALRSGTGGPRRPAEALALHRRLCAAATSASCVELAQMLAAGEGARGDTTGAAEARGRACRLGIASACAP